MSKPPSFYEAFRGAHPGVIAAYEALGDATRRALDAGAEPDAIRHVALLAITTLGFPHAMAIRAMIEDQLAKSPR